MANDDYWRHQSPAPPHAPNIGEHAPGSDQSWGTHAPSPIIDPTWGSGGAGSVARGDPGPIAGRMGIAAISICAFLAAMPASPEIVACLYPLGAGLAIAVSGVAYRLLTVVAPAVDYRTGVALAVVPGLIVWWPASRAEHRFAERRSYRAARHVARVALLAGFAYWRSRSVFGGTWPQSIAALRRVFVSPAQLAIVAGTVVVAHLLLTRWNPLRGMWHVMLESLWLKAP